MSICILAQFNLKCSQDLVLITQMDIKSSAGDHKSSSLNSKPSTYAFLLFLIVYWPHV